MTTDHEWLAERIWEVIWHQGDLDQMDAFFTTDCVRHDPGRELRGIQQVRQFINSQRVAFPDGRFTTEEQIVAGDKVVIRYRYQGTNLGTFQGAPPSGKQVAYTGILIYRVVDGKIAEQWTEFDLLGLLRQVGMLPTS